MRRLANNENGGLLTFGVAGGLWSSSAALVSIVSALNRAYDIDEGRPWWKVRLIRLAARLTDTAERIDAMLTHPTVAQAEGDGRVGAALHTIATVRRTARAWSHARDTGVFRRAAVVAVATGMALAVAAKTKRR